MKKNLIIAVVVIAAALIALFAFQKPAGQTATSTSASTTDMMNMPAQENPAPKTSSAPKTVSSGAITVVISNYAFNPANITVKAGTVVTWVNKDSVPHTVTGDVGGPASAALTLNATYSFKYSAPGIYAYHCSIHPGMKGIITVTK
jgi:plastocyanin